MKKITKIALLILTVFLSSQSSFAEGLVTDILKEMEKRQELGIDITAKVILTEQRVRQGVRQIDYVYYFRSSDDAYLLVAVSPEREKGNGYLRVENNLWIYRKNTRTFQHLSRSDRIGDTDVNAERFERQKFTELYGPVTDENGNELYSEVMLGEISVYKFEVKALVKDVSYPKHIFWVRRDNYLELKRDSYSLSNTLMQTSYTLKYTEIEGHYLGIKGMVIDRFEEGNKTIWEASGISLDVVDDAVFTKAFLENLSK